MTSFLFDFLSLHYKNNKSCDDYFIKQLNTAKKAIECENCLLGIKLTIKKIENLFIHNNLSLIDSIKFVFSNFEMNMNYIEMKYLLDNYLN